MSSNQFELTKERQQNMDKYILLKGAFGLPKGTIFVHDKEDKIRGSYMDGCLKLAWTDVGNCQKDVPYCGGTVVLHADMRNNTEWFKSYKSLNETIRDTVINGLEALIEQIKNI